jgi:MinD-like ATPase involved in chromosome partitioning or flagellar assembly
LLIACWSPKGGSGTTVVAATLGLLLAEELRGGAVVADLEGDVPIVLGMADPPSGRGLRQWLAASADVGVDALRRLLVPADAPGLSVLPAGAAGAAGGAGDGRADDLVTALSGLGPPVVCDCGTLRDDAEVSVAAGATLSLCVVRPCYVALRRALRAPVRPSGVVLVTEPGRSLGRRDVENVLGAPVRAEIELDPLVARAVDAGLLATRLPRGLHRALRDAA